MTGQDVIFNIVVKSKKAEDAMRGFAKVVDTQVDKILKDFDKLEKSLKGVTLKMAALNKEGLDGMIKDIKRASSELNKLESQFKKVDKASRGVGGNSMGGGGRSGGGGRARRGGRASAFGRIGASALGMVGGLAAYEGIEVLKNMYSTGQEFEYVMAQVRGITGATTDEFKKLTSSVEKFASKSSFGLSEFGEAAKFLAMSGADTGTIKNMLPTVGSLAMATGNNMGTTADWLTNISNQFGIDSKDSSKLADIMTGTMTSSNVSMNEYAKSLEYVGTIAAQSGVHITDLSAMVGSLGDLGLKGSKSGTGLRSLLLALSSPNKKQGDLISKYGLQTTRQTADGRTVLNDMPTILKQMSKMTNEDLRSFVGKTGLPAALGLITKAIDGSLEKLDKTIEGKSGATKEQEKIMQNTSFGASKRLSSAWENLSNKLFGVDGEGAGSMGTRLMNNLADGINAIANSEGFQKGIQFLAETFSKIAGYISEIVSGTSVASSVFEALFKTIGAVLTITERFFYFYNELDKLFQKWFNSKIIDIIFAPLIGAATSISKIVDAFADWDTTMESIETRLVNIGRWVEDKGAWVVANLQALAGDDTALQLYNDRKAALNNTNINPLVNMTPEEIAEMKKNTKVKFWEMVEGFKGLGNKLKTFDPNKDTSLGTTKQSKGNIVNGSSEGGDGAVDELAKVSPLTSSANELSRSIIVHIHDGLLHVDNQNVGVNPDGSLETGDMEQKMAEVLLKVTSDWELGMSH